MKNDLIAIKEIFVPKESDDEVVQAQKGNYKYRDLTIWTIVTSAYSNKKNYHPNYNFWYPDTLHKQVTKTNTLKVLEADQCLFWIYIVIEVWDRENIR